MALEKFKEIFGGNTDTDDGEIMEENVEYDASNKMVLLEPRAYSEAQQIADYLKNGSSVVINFKRVTPEQAKRIIDFLNGTSYAIGGAIQKLGGGIFLCTPSTINVEGTISNEPVANKSVKAKTKEEEEDQEDLYL